MLAARRRPLGLLVGFPLLALIVLLAPGIVVSTINQSRAGVEFTPGEMIGPVAGFAVLGGVAIWLSAAVLRAARRAEAENSDAVEEGAPR